MYIIILGGGQVGERLARLFLEDKHDVTILEIDTEMAQRLSVELDALVLNEDGSDQKALVDAEIERADAFVTATSDDKINLFACRIAKKFNVKKIIARVTDPENYEFYLDLDVTPINITVNTVMAIQKAVISSERLNSLAAICGEKAQISGVLLGKKSPVLGKKYGDLKLKQNIFAIEREGDLVLPNGETTIAESDTIFVVAPIEDTENIFRSLRGESH
jgi:trk system potassium uptake protein TrkA|tara:strand:+ start:2282 stop:2938 length:657 start_codon:yes stop_codon:yes gene_type:complete